MAPAVWLSHADMHLAGVGALLRDRVDVDVDLAGLMDQLDDPR